MPSIREQIKESIKPSTLHHAYVLIGGAISQPLIQAELERFLEKDLEIKRAGNADFFVETFEALGVDDVAHILDFSLRTALVQKKIVCITAHSITGPAQNSMLKMLEDPTGETIYFFILRSSAGLLPTFLSRVQTIRLNDISSNVKTNSNNSSDLSLEDIPTPGKFLSAPLAKRMDMIKEIMDKESKDLVSDFLIQLEQHVHAYMDKDSTLYPVLKVFETVGEYKHDVSVSNKMILEYVALKLPILK